LAGLPAPEPAENPLPRKTSQASDSAGRYLEFDAFLAVRGHETNRTLLVLFENGVYKKIDGGVHDVAAILIAKRRQIGSSAPEAQPQGSA
jgi:hypothetical protein